MKVAGSLFSPLDRVSRKGANLPHLCRLTLLDMLRIVSLQPVDFWFKSETHRGVLGPAQLGQN